MPPRTYDFIYSELLTTQHLLRNVTTVEKQWSQEAGQRCHSQNLDLALTAKPLSFLAAEALLWGMTLNIITPTQNA